MNAITAIAVGALALTSVLNTNAADRSIEIKGVHLCCKGCSGAVEKAVAKIPGATVKVDKDSGTVTLSGADPATVQGAADAMVAAGFFGTCSDPDVKLPTGGGAKGKKVRSLTVQGVHLCCGECVSAVEKAIAKVEGAKAHTAVKGAKSFEVTGSFNDKQLMQALEKEGLSGTVAK